MNRIDKAFESGKAILSIYFTAGFPKTEDTLRVAHTLEKAGVDMLEIGIPFSDPVADGPTIRNSSRRAIEAGMTIELLFKQLKALRGHVTVPVLLMGYLNPILQYGLERFCEKCNETGIDGVIIPDLPMEEFQMHYRSVFKENDIRNTFLISPNTEAHRIRVIDEQTDGFIYMVSSSSITGAKAKVQTGQVEYYRRMADMGLKNPRLIGFGISNKETFDTACKYAEGAIIGSAFIDRLDTDASDAAIKTFVHAIKHEA